MQPSKLLLDHALSFALAATAQFGEKPALFDDGQED
jgi:hypothetical protein